MSWLDYGYPDLRGVQKEIALRGLVLALDERMMQVYSLYYQGGSLNDVLNGFESVLNNTARWMRVQLFYPEIFLSRDGNFTGKSLQQVAIDLLGEELIAPEWTVAYFLQRYKILNAMRYVYMPMGNSAQAVALWGAFGSDYPVKDNQWQNFTFSNNYFVEAARSSRSRNQYSVIYADDTNPLPSVWLTYVSPYSKIFDYQTLNIFSAPAGLLQGYNYFFGKQLSNRQFMPDIGGGFTANYYLCHDMRQTFQFYDPIWGDKINVL